MASSWHPGESCSETADTPPCWTRAFLRYRRPASEVPCILCSKVCQIRSVSGPILELFQPYLLLFFDFRPGNYTAIRWESVHYKKPNDSFLRDFCRFSPISRLEFIFQKMWKRRKNTFVCYYGSRNNDDREWRGEEKCLSIELKN